MNIKNLEAINFKGIKKFTMEPQKVNVLVGPNGSGKSSVLSAIRTALTGDVKNPIRNDADEAEVAVNIFGGQILTRHYGEKNWVAINGKKTTQKSIVKLFEDNCDTKLDAMKMLTGGKLITEVKTGNLAKFLLDNDLVPSKMDAKTAIDAAKLTKEAEAILKPMLPLMPETFGMEVLASVAKDLNAQRLALKKEAQTWKGKAVFHGEPPKKSLTAIDRELAELTAGESLYRAYRTQLADYEKAVTRRTTILNNIASEEKRLAGMRGLTAPDKAKRDHIMKIMETLNAAKVSNARTETALKGSTDLLKKALEELSSSRCPLSETLVCTTDKTAVREELESQICKNDAELMRIQNETLTITEKYAKCQEEVSKYEAEYTKYQEYKNAHERLRAMKASIPELPVKPEEPVKREHVAEEMENLKAERKQIMELQTAKEAEAEAAKVEKTILLYDELLNALSPKGRVYSTFVSMALGSLEKYCNARAKKLKKGFEMGISVFDGVVYISCRKDDSEPFVELSECSSGEQLLAVFLILDMLNALSGFGILMLDDLDKLDESSFSALLELLSEKEVLDVYDHIFVAAVDHEDTMNALKERKDIQVICM